MVISGQPKFRTHIAPCEQKTCESDFAKQSSIVNESAWSRFSVRRKEKGLVAGGTRMFGPRKNQATLISLIASTPTRPVRGFRQRPWVRRRLTLTVQSKGLQEPFLSKKPIVAVFDCCLKIYNRCIGGKELLITLETSMEVCAPTAVTIIGASSRSGW